MCHVRPTKQIMNKPEIEKGIKSLCETSAQIKGFYDQPNTLVEALNSVPSSELDKCLEYYGTRSGVIGSASCNFQH